MKSRGMRLIGHVAWMGERRVAYRVLWGTLLARDLLQDYAQNGGKLDCPVFWRM
jgi:hypothetical protein